MPSDYEICQKNGWDVGTRLVGDEGWGPDVIEIRYLSPSIVVCRLVLPHNPNHPKGSDAPWTLQCRNWQKVENDEQLHQFLLNELRDARFKLELAELVWGPKRDLLIHDLFQTRPRQSDISDWRISIKEWSKIHVEGPSPEEVKVSHILVRGIEVPIETDKMKWMAVRTAKHPLPSMPAWTELDKAIFLRKEEKPETCCGGVDPDCECED